MLNTGMATIKAEGANIIKRYDDAELVAVQHSNGFVGIYAEDEGELIQICALEKSSTLTAIELADRMMAK